ncbi:MAG: glycosyltransferase [Bacteroidetes bacterium]|nr:glycosyltransferase [Bacteroidota bacterium]
MYAGVMIVLAFYGANLLWMSIMVVRSEHSDSRSDSSSHFQRPDRWPKVTIQIPIFNESSVAQRVIDACASIIYPRDQLQIQVLDDSTDETIEMTRQSVENWKHRGINISHIHRTDRTGYKAGALAHGLQSATGELIAMFDADFIPPEDFLLSLIPQVDDPNLGMVQVRWSHINAQASLLTQIQAWSLDMHFAIEHVARSVTGCFINFNGTAGLWRRRCIEDSGGWQQDTLTEDLDLSYRAQIKGWTLKYIHDMEAPAELPETLGSLRIQQTRWTKGTAETARKLLQPLWSAPVSLLTKMQGTIHLTSHLVYPSLVLAALLHPLLLFQQANGFGPGEVYFGMMGIGLIGLLGFFLAQLLAQQQLYPHWHRRVCLFPIILAGSMGLAISNTKAVIDGWRKARTPFERTPKAKGIYVAKTSPIIVILETFLAVYSLMGLSYLIWEGIWTAVAFQLIFFMSYLFVTWYNILEAPPEPT